MSNQRKIQKITIAATVILLLNTCASKDLYESCRPTGSFFNPFGSGCTTGSCLTENGVQAVTTPSRRGICTSQCSATEPDCAAGGVCNGKVCLPADK